MYLFFNFLFRIFNKIAKLFESISFKFESSEYHKKAVIKSTTKYNMHTSKNEKYYIEQYWKFIFPFIKNLKKDITIYDLGCGQGRFAFKLSDYFKDSKIYACDISDHAIKYASEISINQGLDKKLFFEKNNILNFVKNKKTNSADLIILTEVLFYYPGWEDDIDVILSLLKPEGKIIISFRSQYYNMLNTVSFKNFNKLDFLINKREGQLYNSAGIFSWNTSEEIKELITSKNLILDGMFGIGVLSGIYGDPNYSITEPSKLSTNDQEKLMNAEVKLGKTIFDSGRYILTIAHKNL